MIKYHYTNVGASSLVTIRLNGKEQAEEALSFYNNGDGDAHYYSPLDKVSIYFSGRDEVHIGYYEWDSRR
jgi:hypothetical protein